VKAQMGPKKEKEILILNLKIRWRGILNLKIRWRGSKK